MYALVIGLFTIAVFSGFVLTSSYVSATNNTSEDNVAITIPVACTLVSSGNNSHSTSIVNGTYATDIGTTNLKVTCNDNQGFAIYAVGYTGNEIGATNSTKLVGTAASSNTTIDTGTATGPVGGNDNSNWAMKLNTTTSPTPTYPITLDNNYNSYSAVPSSYTKVAHRDSGTDIGTSAVGSTLTTTYAAYISKLQYPDTYSGQVKYTLVHPALADVPLPPTELDLEVEKAVQGHGLGDEIEYTITVTNIGDYDAKNVIVSIPELEEEFTVQTLLANDSEEFFASQTIGESEIAAGYAIITARAIADNANAETMTVITEAYNSGPPPIDDF